MFASSEDKPVVVAINSAVNPLLTKEFVFQTIDTLKKAVSPRPLEVKFLELPQLEQDVKSRKADLFLVTSNFIKKFQTEGAKDLTVAASPFSKDPNRSEASLFIVKADRDDLKKISDLKEPEFQQVAQQLSACTLPEWERLPEKVLIRILSSPSLVSMGWIGTTLFEMY